MNKKIMMGIGTSIVMTMPIATVISCNGDNQKTVETTDTKDKAPLKEGKKVLTADERKTIDKIKETLKEDGLYLIKSDYNGLLWKNKSKSKDNEPQEFVKIGKTPGYGLTNSVQLGNNDSIFMIYYDDNNDGITPDNFVDIVFLEDTSTSVDDKVKEVNIDKLKNIILENHSWSQALVKFVENKKKTGNILNKYFGAQNNHMKDKDTTFKSTITEFYKYFVDKYPDIVGAVLGYYGYAAKMTEDFELIEDSTKVNHASRKFTPVFNKNSIFTYSRVGEKLIKMTYHGESNYAMTAGHFRIKKNNKCVAYGSLSIGSEKNESHIDVQEQVMWVQNEGM